MASNDTNKQKSSRKIKLRDIKLKFENNHWNLDFIPYIGQDFIAHSQKNNKSFNTFRNVLILDIGLENNFNSVEEQAANEDSSFCLKKFINSLNDEINIKDLVYHCFLATKKIPKNEDSFFKYSIDVCTKGPVVLDGLKLYNEYKLNEKNVFDINNEDLKLSAKILNEVILQAHPDIILTFGSNLNDLVDFAFFQTFNEELSDFCSKANIKQLVINPNAWTKSECESAEAFKTMRFLQDEKRHRHNSDFNTCLMFIEMLVKDAKDYAQGKKERYCNSSFWVSSELLDAFDKLSKDDDAVICVTKKLATDEIPQYALAQNLFSQDEKNNQRWIFTKTIDELIRSLNTILDRLSDLNDLKENLIDPSKQRYKPQRENDDRVGKGRRKRKKEE